MISHDVEAWLILARMLLPWIWLLALAGWLSIRSMRQNASRNRYKPR